MADAFDLQRFIDAQAPVFETALAELSAGRKQSHWMWFIFPQAAGLGVSPTAQYYAIGSLAEARAYLAHPLLGPRLVRCVEAAMGSAAPTLEALLGPIDALKFVSSVTLFRLAAGEAGPFQAALDRWNGGVPDARTVALLG